MRRLLAPGLASLLAFPLSTAAQPPMPLPATVTGRPAPQPLVPVAAVAARTPSIARYANLAALPPETAHAVLGMRTGAEWLARRQLAHGKFLFGVNPALQMPLAGDSDFRQAVAAWAVCQSAAFTADEKLTACGGQAILTLLAQTKDDPTDATCKVPVLAPGSGSPLGFAAVLALAIYDLPTADARLFAGADKLCGFVRKQVQPDGSFANLDGNDPETPAVQGFALQALVKNHRARPDAPRLEVAGRVTAFHRAAFRSKPHAVLAGAVLPGVVDLYLGTNQPDAAAAAFEMADWLCTAQQGKTDAKRLAWAGSFRAGEAEPGFDSAYAARGLAAATQLTRQLPDVTRYAKYRPATVDALAFCRGLQYTADNTAHFAGEFRAQYLIGGVRCGAADGNIRADATALAVVAFVRFLESGADGRE